MAEIECVYLPEAGGVALGLPGQALFLDNVEPDDTEVADVVADEARDIVIPNQQQVDRHVLAVADQLVLAAGQFEATAFQQVDRMFGQATGFLHRDLDALLGRFHWIFLNERGRYVQLRSGNRRSRR